MTTIEEAEALVQRHGLRKIAEELLRREGVPDHDGSLRGMGQALGEKLALATVRRKKALRGIEALRRLR
jgi:hypothetical protein